jgi:hypothetical protein
LHDRGHDGRNSSTSRSVLFRHAAHSTRSGEQPMCCLAHIATLYTRSRSRGRLNPMSECRSQRDVASLDMALKKGRAATRLRVLFRDGLHAARRQGCDVPGIQGQRRHQRRVRLIPSAQPADIWPNAATAKGL